MKHDRVIFWQEMPSPHQAPWIRALADLLPDVQVLGVFQRRLSQNRLAMGWSSPDYGKAQVVIAPDQPLVEYLLGSDPERTVHIFSGTVHDRKLSATLRRGLASKALVGILSEGRDWRGWKGFMRRIHSFFHERSYRQRVDFVLAIGRVGTNWFNRCGYTPLKVFPFCYVVDNDKSLDSTRRSRRSVVLGAIGRLIPLKRLDLLLNALAEVSSKDWVLKIIGDGEDRAHLEGMVDNLGLRDKIIFMDTMENWQVRKEFQQIDVLVLSSRADGWGAVVSEALMSGVPVICSDYCGSADLIRPDFNGDLFRCDSVDSLAQMLNKWISRGPLNEPESQQIRSWSRCIEGEAVARYFVEIIEFLEQRAEEPPKAPWGW